MNLGGGRGGQVLAFLCLRFKSDSQKTAVQVHIDDTIVRPHRGARVVGEIALLNYAEDLSEAVDQEVITVVALHEAQYVLPDSLQVSILVRLKSGLIAFGSVINDAGGLRSPFGLAGIDRGALIHRVK